MPFKNKKTWIISLALTLNFYLFYEKCMYKQRL